MTVNRRILDMEYAVRGPIPQRAAELKRQGRRIIPCNLGNPQALGQQPISFYREVLSLVEHPVRIERERRLKALFNGGALDGLGRLGGPGGLEQDEFHSDYVLDLSERYLSQMETGMGAYSDSSGPRFIREAVADFIDRRDGADDADRGAVPRSDPEQVFITNGASEGVRYVIDLLIDDTSDGIMIPIPQYPLYSAAIKRCGGVQVDYFLDEESGWALDRSLLESSLEDARGRGVDVKAIVVINPGNPTGAVLTEETVREVVDFAGDNGLAIIADEVYQENVYGGDGGFVSFARVLGRNGVPLFSVHSTSKGYYGECGHRGGYLEIRNAPRVRTTELSFTDLVLKQASVNICSNTVGQLMMYLLVNPPPENAEPYHRFTNERRTILEDLHDKAVMIRSGFDQMEGVSCFGRTGAMYLFPRLDWLPEGTNDFDYCMALLERTGLVTVNGEGFGQRPGTSHLRIAFLPPREVIEEVLPRWIAFHNAYVN
ncbi:MAG: aminotransferase class I/II-fold pyridoxal phosphate-dependent enzyme [Gemmatimonadetes bacterium]|nr:aminotransferase class I/II-fold pyridoxal phosphate-dependent enzyme [Gemmatimonadota bacterium]MYG85629.1 aminotransferase class I/II-fold pyridoxal phosphate-dependent enzyme [Gemmatimonadota bacterium]MYJ91412.1 aminotransferase class I/II-fold pyridoxal phosphate-dependent enzyme [Gemmatimonadota bacterium]